MSVISLIKSAKLTAAMKGRHCALWITVTNSCHIEREKKRERATLHTLIFLVVMPWNLVDKYQNFIRNCYLKRSGEDGANRFFEVLVSSLADILIFS